MTSSNLFPAYFIRRTTLFGRRLLNRAIPEIIEVEMEYLLDIEALSPEGALRRAKKMFPTYLNSLCIGTPNGTHQTPR